VLSKPQLMDERISILRILGKNYKPNNAIFRQGDDSALIPVRGIPLWGEILCGWNKVHGRICRNMR
jgi:hypothetical protein